MKTHTDPLPSKKCALASTSVMFHSSNSSVSGLDHRNIDFSTLIIFTDLKPAHSAQYSGTTDLRITKHKYMGIPSLFEEDDSKRDSS